MKGNVVVSVDALAKRVDRKLSQVVLRLEPAYGQSRKKGAARSVLVGWYIMQRGPSHTLCMAGDLLLGRNDLKLYARKLGVLKPGETIAEEVSP